MNDQQCVVKAIRAAQLILAQHVDVGRYAEQTVTDLSAVLNRNDVVEAVDRLEVETGLRNP